ncbi:mechanosensitive ion channel family protein [Carnimonas nigrificans]|uniref:mechanosensitive ion channel family protein n=1 Tax=Carnimonas nigrificans TaxID=64323 RepID=UPI00046EB473|nr:mechanosensitive ion channel domain-containing protein [Carnimonas nigrificans]
MHYLHQLGHWLQQQEIVYPVVAVAVLLVIPLLVYWLACIFLRTSVRRFILRHKNVLSKDIMVTRRVALVLAVLAFSSILGVINGLPQSLDKALTIISSILWIVSVALLLMEMLDTVNMFWLKKSKATSQSIKGYLQISKLVVSALALILIIASLTGRPPAIIISSFGAAAAVLIFVFQHTLLSFIANIQISAARAINIQDWIKMPGGMVDGEVMDIALHTVRVRNWDNTMARVPIRNFITEPWINWQPVFNDGRGRRIKRSFHIDQNSIEFADEELLAHLRDTFIHYKEIETGDDISPAELFAMNSQQLREAAITNMGLLRAHILHYLRSNQDIHHDMFVVVRYLEPTSEGVPMELYCFSIYPNFADYERVQAKVTEYVYAVASHFRIRIFQTPAGQDLIQGIGSLGQREGDRSSR